MKRLMCVLAFALASVGGAAGAATVTWLYQVEVDATAVGLSQDEALEISLTFDPDTAPTVYSQQSISQSAQILGSASIGGETATFDGYIQIGQSQAGHVRNWFQFANGSSLSEPGMSCVALVGYCLSQTWFYLWDNDQVAFADISVLPSDLSFLAEIDFSSFGLSLADPLDRTSRVHLLGDARVFSVSQVTEIPLPATLPLMLAGLAGLGWVARRRASS